MTWCLFETLYFDGFSVKKRFFLYAFLSALLAIYGSVHNKGRKPWQRRLQSEFYFQAEPIKMIFIVEIAIALMDGSNMESKPLFVSYMSGLLAMFVILSWFDFS